MATTKKPTPIPRTASSGKDPTTKYAKAVLAGKITAGPHVRAACARHIKDLEEGAKRGLTFDLTAARRTLDFFTDMLRLNGGEWEGRPFEPFGWEVFVIGCLFGWKGADGFRRFRMGYVETGKGSGKSPLAAGIGLYGLMADGESRPEIYAAATKKDQAMVLFRDAVAMNDLSPEISKRLTKSGAGQNCWNLAYMTAGGFFRPISADHRQSGPRPHMALLDEVHEHPTNLMVELLRAGTKWRRQALIFMITNSGTDRHSVCWDYHDYATKVATGQIADDSFFGYVCGLDVGDDPFKDEGCWIKANPSLAHGIPGKKYLREQVQQARGMPSKESVVRRLSFCEWVDAAAPWLNGDLWMGATDSDFNPEDWIGRREVTAGLDLSSTQDLTALVLAFAPCAEDPVTRLVPYFWLPGDGLHEKAERDRVPYLAWRDGGYLEALPGRAISKLAVLHRVAELHARYEISALAYDMWRMADLQMQAQEEGVTLPELLPFGQGYKSMAPAIDEFERRLLADEMRHNGNPVMTWCAANAVLDSDPAGNRKPTKERATGRIDGIVAGVMAIGISQSALASSERSFWESVDATPPV